MNEHPMSIEIRKLEAEIERLKETTTHLQRECAKRGQRVADLERLIIRAADALERPETRAYMQQWVESLIAELRKAN